MKNGMEIYTQNREIFFYVVNGNEFEKQEIISILLNYFQFYLALIMKLISNKK